MQASFFGTDADMLQVWRWIYDVSQMKLCQHYSSPGQPNRWFDNWNDVVDHLSVPYAAIAGWPSSVGGKPIADFVTFTPETQRETGAEGRTVLRSPALITSFRNNDQNGCLAVSHVTCWTEKGARQRSIYSEQALDAVDWKAFTSIARALQRRIAKASPAKLDATPIMLDAWQKLKAQEIQLWGWGEACGYPSPGIVEPE